MHKIVECVPNISNGRDPEVYNAVAAEVARVGRERGGAVRLLDVDPGFDTNRTVITFAGEPEAVLEAALALAAKAFELIDMRGHNGAHPRHGALDVLPFVPVGGATLDDCAELARRAGAALGALGAPVWLYERAARDEAHRSLSDLRAGEYESLRFKLDPAAEQAGFWRPDYGPFAWDDAVARSGVCTVGARKFLIAYNINFNTRSTRLVSDIALSIREKGRIARDAEGRFVRDADGNPVYTPGMFAHCKAMGWYIDEYQLAQITMNLTDWESAPLHSVFDTVQELALEKGLRVTGSELVGLVPLGALTAAGRYFLDKQRVVCTGASEAELIRVAVQSLGLAELAPFDPRSRIVEYALEGSADEARAARPLVHMTLREFTDELASGSPAPGGGSAAALAGALAAGLAAMVPNLTVGKKGYKDAREQMNAVAEEAQAHKDAFLRAIDDDTAAFNALMSCFRLPKDTPEAEAARAAAILAATIGATQVPLETLQRCARTAELCRQCALAGNQNSLSDAGVAAALTRACAEGAYYNVLINLRSLDADIAQAAAYAQTTRADADALLGEVAATCDSVREIMAQRL